MKRDYPVAKQTGEASVATQAANPSLECRLDPNAAEVDTQGTEEVLLALALAVEQRDNVTAGHCERLALTSLALGMSLSLDEESLLALYRGGFLHDVGKVGIPDSILLKPAALTSEEWAVMQSHPGRGAEICGYLKSLARVVPIVRHHHERFDGSGYPDGLRGDQVPLLARILQVTDIYDALTNSRCYKPACSPKQAIRIIEEETAKGWRDPEIVTKFLRIHKDVITPTVDYTHKNDCSLRALHQALVNLSPIMKPMATFVGGPAYSWGPAA
jgi:HD-GYP domain-containing protein (c-di-GMP phosphodiesterase class II)